MKKWFIELWAGLKYSSLYRFWFALIFSFIGFCILAGVHANYWYLLIIAPTTLYVLYLFIKMLLYAWIINPIKSLINKFKK